LVNEGGSGIRKNRTQSETAKGEKRASRGGGMVHAVRSCIFWAKTRKKKIKVKMSLHCSPLPRGD